MSSTIIPDSDIIAVVNEFVQKNVSTGFHALGGVRVALFYSGGKWALDVLPPYSRKAKTALTKFTLPRIPDDPACGLVALTGFLSSRLRNYNTAKKASAARSPELRRAIAASGVQGRQIRRKKS